MSRLTSTMTISLPKHLKEFVKERSLTAHYGTPSDYPEAALRFVPALEATCAQLVALPSLGSARTFHSLEGSP